MTFRDQLGSNEDARLTCVNLIQHRLERAMCAGAVAIQSMNGVVREVCSERLLNSLRPFTDWAEASAPTARALHRWLDACRAVMTNELLVKSVHGHASVTMFAPCDPMAVGAKEHRCKPATVDHYKHLTTRA